jgi:pseudaminic acid synthase
MLTFEIEGRAVGDGAPTLIVAELSANHGGSLERAIKTIEAAAEAGVDAIKIQTYTPDTLTLDVKSPEFVVKTKNDWAGRTLHDLYAEAMTPWEWHAALKEAAVRAGLIFFSTPFDPTAVALLEELRVPCYKIASFELVDLPLIEHTARMGKPMILSTGMASFDEIEAAVRACRSAGNDRIALLRCVSSYPAKPDAMHLPSIEKLKSFGVVVGLSDHTRDSTVAIASVALGARIVEKHFTLDRSAGGPDSFFSLEPS